MDATHCHESNQDPEPSQQPMPVALLKAGDPAAWGKLKEFLGRFVLNWTRHVPLNGEDLEDLMQEVFLAVKKRIAGFKEEIPRGGFFKWLKRVTGSKAIDLLRGRRGEPVARGGDGALQLLAQVRERVPADGGGTDHLGDEQWALQMEALRRARAGMENNTWLALWRLVADGRPGREVSAELGMSPNAVYQAKYCVIERARREYAALAHGTVWTRKR
jgi:RNA polymerase sigma factor (sigma-70 family)